MILGSVVVPVVHWPCFPLFARVVEPWRRLHPLLTEEALGS